MSDKSLPPGEEPPAPDASATAAVVAGVLKRVLDEQPLRRHGDELEVVEFVLSAWNREGIEDAMQLNALTMVMCGVLPVLVLTQLVEASDELGWLVSFDVSSARETLERSGIAAWCADLGSPLDEAPDPVQLGASVPAATSPAAALALVREFQERPEPADELEAHRILDAAVAKVLPLGHDVLEWIEEDRELGGDELRPLVVASLRLLAASRMTGGTVLPGIAWSEPDPDGLEAWGAYFVLTTLVGLNLRVLAETSSPSERSALLHFDHDDLQVLAERLDGTGSGDAGSDGT